MNKKGRSIEQPGKIFTLWDGNVYLRSAMRVFEHQGAFPLAREFIKSLYRIKSHYELAVHAGKDFRGEFRLEPGQRAVYVTTRSILLLTSHKNWLVLPH